MPFGLSRLKLVKFAIVRKCVPLNGKSFQSFYRTLAYSAWISIDHISCKPELCFVSLRKLTLVYNNQETAIIFHFWHIYSFECCCCTMRHFHCQYISAESVFLLLYLLNLCMRRLFSFQSDCVGVGLDVDIPNCICA